MTTPYDTIKTRLKTILQSERTIEFLDKLTNFGLSLGNSIQITNKFIKEVFQGEGIEIESKNNRKNFINNVIIDDKKFLIRTNSIKNKAFFFKTFKYKKQDQIDFSKIKENINKCLDHIDYFFIIRIKEEYNEESDELKLFYYYYLFPSEYFRIKENFPLINNASLSGLRWHFRNYNEFYFKYDVDSLISFNICSPYICLLKI